MAKVTLGQIVDAGDEGMLVLKKDVIALEKAGYVEINEKITDGNKIACRATDAGFQKANMDALNKGSKTDKPKTSVSTTSFAIDDDIDIPEITHRAGRSETYPFDALKVGQSFFVPNTEEKPDIAKSIASTVSGANARYAIDDPDGKTKTNRKGVEVPVKIYTRRFVHKRYTQDGVDGARVWRVE